MAIAKARKKCPWCGKIIEIGAECVVHSFAKTRWGWQSGGFIGSSSSRRTHLYHPNCFLAFQIGASNQQTETENEA